MNDQLVSVVDGTKARYFSVGKRAALHGEERNQLVEVATLINPANRIADEERTSDGRPGLQSGAGTTHGVDDRHDSQSEETHRKFAKLVLEKMSELIREHEIRCAILAAGPKMLGYLRENREMLPHIDIGELPKHLTELSPHDLCLKLEAADLL